MVRAAARGAGASSRLTSGLNGSSRGHTIDRVGLFGRVDVDLSRLPSRFPFVLITPQYETERLLAERARNAGAQIIEGMEVTGLHPTNGGAHLQAGGASGEVRTFAPSFVVGADGVHSTVRDVMSIPFPGRSVMRSVMLADVRLAEPPPDILTVNATRAGFAFIAPFGDGWFRVIAWNRHRQVPDSESADLDEIRHITRQALGSDFGMHDARWMSRFHNDERQVPHYRSGPVFLAGDAANVHSPAGGQGMNTGLQDAANLSWKLAAVARHGAHLSLLDTYHDERYPVGRFVVRMSHNLLRLTLVKSDPVRQALSAVAGPVTGIGPVTSYVARAISGIGIGYRGGPGAHPLAGRRAPDTPLAGEGATRLYELLREGKFVLLTHVRIAMQMLRSQGPSTDTMASGGRHCRGRTTGWRSRFRLPRRPASR